MPVSKVEVLHFILSATTNNEDNGTEQGRLLVLAVTQPGLWEGLESEDDVVGILRAKLRGIGNEGLVSWSVVYKSTRIALCPLSLLRR